MKEKGGEKKTRGRRGIAKKLYCYRCGKPVSSEDTECPHCGATGEKAPTWVWKVALGFVIGFMLWLLFWM